MQRRNEAVQVVWFAHRHILYASPLFCRLPPVCSASAVKSLPVPGPICGCLRMLRVTLPPLTHTEIASGAPDPSQKGTAQVQISGKVPYAGSRWIREKKGCDRTMVQIRRHHSITTPPAIVVVPNMDHTLVVHTQCDFSGQKLL